MSTSEMTIRSGRIALVTGGSRGLGRNMAMQLARDGHDVIVTYRTRRDEADEVVGEVQSLGRKADALALDTAKIEGFPAFLEALTETLAAHWDRDRFDFLINNAGIGHMAMFMQTTPAAFDELMNVHFRGVFFLTQTLVPRMADGGRIVNVSSGLARFTVPGRAAYAAMKGAIEVLTRYLARELGPRRITVNVVAPGVIETDFTQQYLAQEGAREQVAANIALGRVGVPDDIGGVVAFLCSEAGRWVNGQRIEASGGMNL